MYIESIQINAKQLHALAWHQARVNATLQDETRIDLAKSILLPTTLTNDIYKCRVVYDTEKIQSIEFSLYKPLMLKTLAFVEDNEIDYSSKYQRRSDLERLKQKTTADEVIIVKNGWITDTSYSNLVFWDGAQWHTPNTYLLNGTMRQRLLQEGKIIESPIRPSDVGKFKSLKLINAMLDLESSVAIPIASSSLLVS
jgi:4-amino-4-deoxychorismate lyase